ncbi:MAG: hypothetical protein MUC58_14780, partial [Rhizobiaceae bacterium]|nr:hypothetical protein [Rhizobiaceae bacterium]
SDIIANRQIDVWEIAWVWAYPCERHEIEPLESALFHAFNVQSTLMNGSVPRAVIAPGVTAEPAQRVQVIDDHEIAERIKPNQRLPRQALHYSSVIGHFLAVKNSEQIGRSIQAHFERMQRYHRQLLQMADITEDD